MKLLNQPISSLPCARFLAFVPDVTEIAAAGRSGWAPRSMSGVQPRPMKRSIGASLKSPEEETKRASAGT